MDKTEQPRSISDILELTKELICDGYCKYSANWDYEKDGDLSESEVCANCPLQML